MAGGSDASLEKGKFLLSEMSDANKLYLVPGGIGAGSNMKMLHQVLAAIHILAASEAMGFAAHLGLDPKEIGSAIVASDAWSWMHENRINRMVEEDYYPGVSALTIILKDVVSFLEYLTIILFSFNAVNWMTFTRASSPPPPASTTSQPHSAQPPNKST